MEVKLNFPDAFYNKDSKNYDKLFEALQLMLNRMAVSHEKYQGDREMDDVVKDIDEIKSALQRLTMYSNTPMIGEVWDGAPLIMGKKVTKPLNTGNTENLLDAANMLVIEFLFPKHPKANFKAQTSKESPGLELL